jgi:hypothetical protein
MPKKLQPFANQKSGQASQTLDKFHDALEHYSGGDSVSLLKRYFFSYKKGKKLLSGLELTSKDKLNSIIKSIQKKHEATKKNEKASLLSTLSRDFTRSELQNYGFKISKTQFKNSRNPTYNPKTPGRRPLSNEIKQTVLNFIQTNSRQSFNKRIVVQRKHGETPSETMEVRYIDCCFKCLYVKFCQANGKLLGETKFREIIPKNIQQPRKATGTFLITFNSLLFIY